LERERASEGSIQGSPNGTTAASPSKPPRRRTKTNRPPCFTCAKLTTGKPNVAMPPRHMLRTKVRRFMVISIEKQDLPVRARHARPRGSSCRQGIRGADLRTGDPRDREALVGR